MDFSWSEMLLVGVVALIVIGPKDLPGMFRELGRITAKLRAMGREFSRAMEQAAKESGVKDVASDLNAVADPLRKAANPSSLGLDAVKSAADRFEKWDPLKNAAKPTAPLKVGTPVVSATAPAEALTAPVAPAAAAAAVAVPAAAGATMGPATAALAAQQAERKAASAETAARLRDMAEARAQPGADAGADPTPRKPGRTRSAPKSEGDPA